MDNLQLGSNLSIDSQIENNLTYLSIPFIAAFSLNSMSVGRLELATAYLLRLALGTERNLV